MGINGISTGYTADYENRKVKNSAGGNGFAGYIRQNVNAVGTNPFAYGNSNAGPAGRDRKTADNLRAWDHEL